MLEYDDVMNIQRKNSIRNVEKSWAGVNLVENINFMLEKRNRTRLLKSYITPEMQPEEYVYDEIKTMIKELHFDYSSNV